MQCIVLIILLIEFLGMWQTLGHCDEPRSFLASEGLFVDALHHVCAEARAIAENHVGVRPFVLVNITQHDFKSGRTGHRPPENLLVVCRIHFGQVGIVNGLEVERDILEAFQDLNAPHSLELVHHGSGQDPLARAMAQIDEGATRDVERVMPAVRVFVLPRFLDPLEDLKERLELNLAIRQVYILQTTLVSFTSAFKLYTVKQDSNS